MIRPDSHIFDAQTFSPERRADHEAQALAERLERISAKAAMLNASGDAVTIPAEVVENLTARHVRATRAYWAAESRCASSMIVGPARFPVERNRKRMETAHKRMGEVRAHLDAAMRRLERLAYPYGLPGAAILSRDPDALDKLWARLAEVEAEASAYKAANAALRKGDWAGVAAAVGQERADREKAFIERWGYGGFHTANRRAEIRRLQDRIAAMEANAKRGTVEVESDGVRMVENVEAGRVQLFFPGKPDDATRAKLKGAGFRWAPSEGAWQRHLNNAGRYAAKSFLGMVTPPARRTLAEIHGIAITARFTDDDAANDYMADHPGEGVLEVVGGEIQIARCDDLGVR